jgi:lycopene beta-cyclase
MLAYRLSQETAFAGHRILLIDREERKGNDRTWCYWEEGPGEWDDFLLTSWDRVQFKCDAFTRTETIAPYKYKMLRSSKLYSFLQNRICENNQFNTLLADVLDVTEQGEGGLVHTTKGTFRAPLIFTSIFPVQKVASQQAFPYLKQHFIGWFVRTEAPVFDPSVPVFMDFTVAQRGNTRFMYVLPVSATEALVEYTLFSADLLTDEEYESEIRQYLEQMGAGPVEVLEKEKGNIPMTCYPFSSLNSRHIVYIGSAGGWTKASTGFTFMRICQFTRELVSHLAAGREAHRFRTNSRYTIYDLIFLDVLHRKNHLGARIFSRMFEKNTFPSVLRFLDERSTFWSDLQIIRKSEPRLEFVRSVFQSLRQLITI